MLKLAEPPFLSIQGEGPTIGKPAVFLRLAECNLRCSFCDTKYTWQPGSKMGQAPKYIEYQVRRVSQGCRRLVITGGEPLLQYDGIAELLDADCLGLDWAVELETNGTLPLPTWPHAFDRINVSPKLSNSLVPLAERYRPEILRGYVNFEATFKFVVGNPECVAEARDMAEDLELSPTQVILMPLATDVRIMLCVMKDVYPAAMDWGVRLLPRLHILLGVK